MAWFVRVSVCYQHRLPRRAVYQIWGRQPILLICARATNNCYKGVAISEIALSIRLDINEIGFDLIDMDSALVHGGCNHSYSSMES